jgi:hypothetical protein
MAVGEILSWTVQSTTGRSGGLSIPVPNDRPIEFVSATIRNNDIIEHAFTVGFTARRKDNGQLIFSYFTCDANAQVPFLGPGQTVTVGQYINRNFPTPIQVFTDIQETITVNATLEIALWIQGNGKIQTLPNDAVPTTITPPPPPPSNFTLRVNAKNTVTGGDVAATISLWDSANNPIGTKVAPATFDGLPAGFYQVSASTTAGYNFTDWDDNGSTSNLRTINLTSDVVLVANYAPVAPPPPTEATVTCPPFVEAGTNLIFSGTGYLASEGVVVEMNTDPQLAVSVTADSSGNISGSIPIPADYPPGTYSVVSVGMAGSHASTTTTVTAPGGGGGGGGSSNSLGLFLAGGLGLVALWHLVNRK